MLKPIGKVLNFITMKKVINLFIDSGNVSEHATGSVGESIDMDETQDADNRKDDDSEEEGDGEAGIYKKIASLRYSFVI